MNAESTTRTIPDEFAGLRLDQALARLFPEFSRSRLKSWLQGGALTVDGGCPRPKDPVQGGESVALQVPDEVSVAAEPEAIELDVVFEDASLLVVNKPAGLVVHPGAGNSRGTLLNGLLHYDGGLEALPRAGIVHRLDKDTSGLMLVARTLPAHTTLVRALGEREISRHYLAVCTGVLTGGGTIDAPIGRHRVDRTRMAVRDDGREAVSHFVVLERFRAHTYINVQLETGRTHQIRVHFAHRRHSLVGDPVYGGRLALPRGASDRLVEALRAFRRQALHAAALDFAHPDSGERIALQADPPADFERLLAVLREDAG